MAQIKVKNSSNLSDTSDPNTRKISHTPANKIEAHDDDEIYVHNKKLATFFVPRNNNDPKSLSEEESIVFQPDEIISIQAKILKERRFSKCFEKGFLEIFTEEQKLAHEAKAQKAKAKKVKEEVAGTYEPSGLPNNRNLAIATVEAIRDLDLLEALRDKEDRSSVLAAIEDQIERVEDGEFADNEVE